jgi:hypothetical protein
MKSNAVFTIGIVNKRARRFFEEIDIDLTQAEKEAIDERHFSFTDMQITTKLIGNR